MAKADLREIADEIKRQVSCRTFAETVMGLQLDPRGLARCPFHNEKTASFKVYGDGRGWTCFGCHKGGDVINLAKDWYVLNFKETLRQLDQDFGLKLFEETPEAQIKRQKRDAERLSGIAAAKREEREKRKQEAVYWKAVKDWRFWDGIIKDLAPFADKCPKNFEHAIRQKAACELTIGLSDRPSPYGLMEKGLRAEYAVFRADREIEYAGRDIPILSYDTWARCRLINFEKPIEGEET